jgi:hypothetical protein
MWYGATMIDIHSKVQAAQERLTSELYDLFREALAGMASDVGRAKPAPKAAAKKAVVKKAVAKKPAAKKPVAKKAEPKKVIAKPVAVKPAAKKPVAKKAEPKKVIAKPEPKKAAKAPKPGKRIRRSLGQLKADAEKVTKLLAANKGGLRIEQINKLLGTSTRQLARPILKLLQDRKIRKAGDRRATVYFPG